MVTNESGIGEDWAQVTEWVGDKAKAAGQAVGLVEDDIIPGNPETAHELAGHLADLGGGFEKAGEGFKRIDDGGWTGQAADGARAYIETCPPKWFDASDAFTEASKAVADYQRVLAQQQAKAARAKGDLERAEEASDAARDAHNDKVDAFNASDRTGPRPGAFVDPAAGDIAAARRAIEEAKAAVAAADQRAAQVVRAAAERAPAEPGWLAQKAQDLEDAAQTLGRMGGSFATSAGSAAVDLAKLGRMVLPFDPHKILHPADAAAGFSSMAAGLATAAMDPYAAVKTIVNIDGWREDPAGEMGSLSLDALASLAGGGGVASKLARSVGDLADTGSDLARHAGELTPQRTPDPGPNTPGEPAQRPSTPSEMGTPNSQPSSPFDARHSADPSPVNGRPEPQGPPAASQSAGWQQPSSTSYGEQHSMVGPREDGGFGPRGSSAAEPAEPPAAQEKPPVRDDGFRPDPSAPDQTRVDEAMAKVRAGGDGIGLGPGAHTFEPGATDLPDGLTRSDPDPWQHDAASPRGDAANSQLIFRDVDPADENNALWRAAHSDDLTQLFKEGVNPKNLNGGADIHALSGHLGGATENSRFVSTTNELEQALHRAQTHGDSGVILKIRSGGGIDADATMHDQLGDKPFGYTGHGEREISLRDGVNPRIIEGAHRPVSWDSNGKPTGYEWIPNPHFDRTILERSR